ncbi:ankyrin repeat domain-containing protein [Massilia norwichensis]|uniref:Ankyrin repeat domain-containing protein n=1 Tax=Massilia norwichensis TaxID=1442366 RepID=A0ABT2ABD6_9BURK|nr:ankyrin repeat domain-containing protein [Massilia norwichensis]MCS0591387.1 ankyrin repeat domain-containing protein [Massilia norwichensis]
MMQRRGFLRLTGRSILAAMLLSAFPGAAVLAATPQQISDFFRAVQMDDAATVKSLLAAGVNPNQQNPVGGEPALVLAAREGSMRVLRVLLDHPRIQIDAPAINGNTALMMAAFKRNRAAAEALVARGAAVNRPGWTPLHYAAASGDEDIARLLIKRGAKIDALSPPASGSYTPLMMAAREGHPDMVAFLTEQGANPKLANSEGLTAAQIADKARAKR